MNVDCIADIEGSVIDLVDAFEDWERKDYHSSVGALR